MHITNVRTAQPIAANSPPDWRTSLGQIAVAVDTDEGITGYGVGGGGAAGRHVIDAVLRDVVLGASFDHLMHTHLWDAMSRATLPFGRKGIAIMAISGVDLAVWDARAKAQGVSVAELLGATDERLDKLFPTYSTVWNDVDAETAAGSQPVKLHVHPDEDGPYRSHVKQYVARAREAIGPDRELMIDAWMEWDLATTLEIARQIEPYGITFIEEPLPAWDLKGYEQLVRECPIPIAGGEHEFGIDGFSDLIDRKLHEILQPDVCWCGGLTVLRRIYELAAEAELRVIPHRGSEVWGLHAIAALDPNPLAESGRPWMGWVEGQPSIEEGHIRLPDGPGFGVTIDESWFGST
jgi:L-alanine-DL-glutamate epimerase-like enolase superfamily enzyme